MIDEKAPAKLAEIIRDTWPNIYRPPAKTNTNIKKSLSGVKEH
jgi:hypothetical protein